LGSTPYLPILIPIQHTKNIFLIPIPGIYFLAFGGNISMLNQVFGQTCWMDVEEIQYSNRKREKTWLFLSHTQHTHWINRLKVAFDREKD